MVKQIINAFLISFLSTPNMVSELGKKMILWGVFISGGGILGSYLIWIWKGCRSWMPHISDFDLAQPESTIFSITSTLAPILIILGLIDRYKVKKQWFKNNNIQKNAMKLEFSILIIGVFCCVVLIGIGYFTWDEYVEIHGLLAGIFFNVGVIWCIIILFSSFAWSQYIPDYEWLFKIRLIGTLTAIIGLIAFSIQGLRILNKGIFDKSHNVFVGKYIESTKNHELFCKTTWDPMLNWHAGFEWVLVFGITIVAFTLALEKLMIHEQE